MSTIPYATFAAVDLRIGRIVQVDDFPEARKPAYKLVIDFGADIGIKKSSAQITELYGKEHLLNRLVVCVVNFEPKQIGPIMSECLTCGAADAEGRVVLLSLEHDVPLGSRIF